MWKGLGVWALFIVLHFGYKWFPSHLFTLLGCPYESVFQHMKMAFFAFTFVSLVEWVILGKGNRTKGSFWMSRLLSAVLLSLIVYPVWYLYPILFGLIEAPGAEILYSNITLVICITITLVIEEILRKASYPAVAKIAILFLFVSAALNYSILAFRSTPVGLFEKVVHTHGAGDDQHGDEGDMHEHEDDSHNEEGDH